MVKSYCVKQKKQTECVPGSERYVKAKNGRTMMKCTCAECGITKTKFVKSTQSGGAATRKKATGPYCGIKKVPEGRTMGNPFQCAKQIRQYGIQKLSPGELAFINRKEIEKENRKKEKVFKDKLKMLDKKYGLKLK